ncbi:MAG: hypothetical protein ACOX8S_08785 [Christensenellales bacterium]
MNVLKRASSARAAHTLHGPICAYHNKGGRRADGSYDEFKQGTLAPQLTLNDAAVPGWHTIYYKGALTGDMFCFNAATNEPPIINGIYVDYAPKKVWDSPHLQSEYNSAVVYAYFEGETMKLGFTALKRG